MNTRRIIGLCLFAVMLASTALRAQNAPAPKPGAAKPPAARLPTVDPGATPVAQWIWMPGKMSPDQHAYFRGYFDSGLAAGQKPKSATLFASCDNEIEVLVNGKQSGRSIAWELPVQFDVTDAIVPGQNLIVVHGQNRDGSAGMMLKLQVVRPDGSKLEVVSDGTWKTNPDVDKQWWSKEFDDSAWKPARVIGPYGMAPWGKLPKDDAPGAVAGKPGEATPAENLKLLPGFKAERLYSVPKAQQGSWVSMCVDHKGRLIVSDQSGPMFRVTVGATPEDTKVEKLNLPLGHAQGLLWAHDSLYVVVNGGGISGNGGGLYRVAYDAKTDQLTEVKKLKPLAGRGGGTAGGEHGPHAVRLGPDGKLYVIAGNFTRIPDGLSSSTSGYGNWGEDLLLPRNPDGGGHDPQIWAPAGWIARADAEGQTWELVAAGLRNSYDFDFNAAGELFTYDSDMEWDTGSPWYRPTRVLMLTSGGEYGWRNGTGKWPDTYPDSLPAVANTGLGSPTGVLFGHGAKFPAKYQQALFCLDWSYGKIYAVHTTPDGAGYRSTFEPFVEGKAFGVTDAVIGNDGAMYVTIGGRNNQSGLYRISYIGDESTAKPQATADAGAEARAIRHQLEQFHVKQDPAAVAFAWQHLNSRDRYLRFAARVALERQDLAQWRDKALAETKPTASINALVGLIRAATAAQGGNVEKLKESNTPYFVQPTPGITQTIATPKVPATDEQAALQPKVLAALDRLPLQSLSEEQLLEALRAYSLTFIRLGAPSERQRAALVARLEGLFPNRSPSANRELVQLLAYLQSPNVVEKALKLLAASPSQEDQIHYALAIRGVRDGWDIERRKDYFAFLNRAEKSYRGGNSFRKFLQRIGTDAMALVPEADKAQIEQFLRTSQPATIVQQAAPRQFVRNWQMADLLPVVNDSLQGRNYASGKAAFEAVQCAKCHKFGDAGGGDGIGPDITGVGQRFQPADLLESILLPSKAISDQYQTIEVRTKDGDVVVGHVEGETDQQITVLTNPFDLNAKTAVKKSDITLKRASPLSLMPEGLVDTLSKEEILDMIAYLRAAGDPKDKAFAGK